ncbi:hypothetical protein [Flaviaesturariibacter amylovorans]|uniref:Uncharacterized protein n=1 Tax=Flaviaesturariibacter amylovorans TaxID=1084520 RepID=A0ABP8HUF4_9BACT
MQKQVLIAIRDSEKSAGDLFSEYSFPEFRSLAHKYFEFDTLQAHGMFPEAFERSSMYLREAIRNEEPEITGLLLADHDQYPPNRLNRILQRDVWQHYLIESKKARNKNN